MKFKFITGLLLGASVLATSCQKDFLDRNPLDVYSNPSLWASEKDAMAALTGVYNGWESADNIIYMDAATDNAYNPYPWEGYTNFGNGFITPTDGSAANRWSFKNIQRANWLLENIDVAPMADEIKNRIKAEARFLRTYQYFISTQLYGDMPLVTTNITPEEANTIPQTSKADVQKFMLAELTEIAEILPVSYSGNDVGRITKGAALSLKARIELYTQDFTAAVASYEKVMGLGYSLFPSYVDLFRPQNENNSEVILDVQYKENDSENWVLGVLSSSSFGGWSSVVPTQALVDGYEMANGKTITEAGSGFDPKDPYANRDPRLQASVVVPGSLFEGRYYNPIESSSSDFYLGDNNSKTGYSIRKHAPFLSDFADIWNTGQNAIVIRYAEVLLGYAEAKIELGQTDQSVYDAINKVRERAGMPKVDQAVYAGQAKLRELVRRERNVELALEGLRLFDIQRWKIGEEVMNAKLYGAPLGTVDPTNGKLTLGSEHIFVEDRIFSAKNYLWPVPQAQIDVNKNLKQNPGF